MACVLVSGSKGNSLFISNGQTAILIDAGLSGREIERRLKAKNLSPYDLDAIIVSHEHSDHIRGVGVLSRRFNLPVHISLKTLKSAETYLGRLYKRHYFDCGQTFSINDLRIRPFSISHDAEDPSGFTVHSNGVKLGIATDLGIATNMVKQHLKNCQILILEANHDSSMLLNGPYPWPLKQRIRSRVGHLSNTDSKCLLKELQHDSLQHVILAHLSEQNNTPEKAFIEVNQAITNCKPDLHVALQDISSSLISI